MRQTKSAFARFLPEQCYALNQLVVVPNLLLVVSGKFSGDYIDFRIGQRGRQGHVEAKLLHHIWISPCLQEFFLSPTERRRQTTR